MNEDLDWSEFKDEYLMFPTANIHDDLIDALSDISQMSVTTYNTDEIDDVEEDYVDDVDVICGM